MKLTKLLLTALFSLVCLSVSNSQIDLKSNSALHSWNFSEGNWIKNTLSDRTNRVKFEADNLLTFGSSGELILSGMSGLFNDSTTPSSLPKDQITVEAVVTITEGQQWGSIIGYAQDNGSYERGWILGYNEDSFLFWISTGGPLIQATSKTKFERGMRYHVVGTYDGSAVKIYVNGKLSAQTNASGPIVYPKSAFYTVGIYKDDDESYPMNGSIFAAQIHNIAVGPSSILAQSNKLGLSPIKFSVQPSLRFISGDGARITWTSSSVKDMTVHFGKTRRLGNIINAQKKNDQYFADLSQLEPDTEYFYKLVESDRGSSGPTYEFNTNLNFSVPSVPAQVNSKLRERAQKIINESGCKNGYCLVLGSTDPDLLVELARLSRFSVISLQSDQSVINELRGQLYKLGVQGSRVNVLKSDDLTGKIPLTSCMINLVVSVDRKEDDEIRRVLVPGRGRAIFLSEGNRLYARPKLPGSGDWTHQYGDAGNTTSTKETLAGATGTHEFSIQWVGRPGADFGIDRNPRMPAPLSAGGILFHQGMNRLVALDAHNGSVLWSIEAPDLRRVNIPRDCGNWCADDDRLYVAVNDLAWIFDSESGQRVQTVKVIKNELSTNDYEWGYIGRIGDNLIGSATRAETSYKSFWSGKMWYDGKGGDVGTQQVCSDFIFGYSLKGSKAKPSWRYENGVILNPTISCADRHLYFIETRNPKIKKQENRRVSDKSLWLDQFLVCIDTDNGKVIWEKPIDTEDGLITFYLQATKDRLILTASNSKFHIYTFKANNGEPIWSKSSNWADDHHSGHMQHPVVTNDKIYLQPNGYDLSTGEILTTKMGKREGCHTYVGAGDALLYRGKARQISMWSKETESTTSWPRLRPSCWLNTIPASGMILIPEGGGGCSCGGWMETSLGFIPRKHLLNTAKEGTP